MISAAFARVYQGVGCALVKIPSYSIVLILNRNK